MSSPSKSIGDRVGPYQLTAILGAGGAGQVFRATWDPTDEERSDAPADHPPEVALKLLRPDVAANEAVFRRFVREIGLAQQLHHPHIIRHYDSGLADDFVYYAMEVVPYGSLREVLVRRQTLPWRDAVEAAAHIADALGALHDAGVVHRDLKPENVFLSEEGALKLGDFGLALKDDASRLTLAGQTVGSARYMAPEQVRGLRDIDGRCDLYALGCVLMEMLSGKPPFDSADAMITFQQHVEAPPPRLRAVAPTAPSSLEEFQELLLEKEKRDRPATAQGVSAALRAILASEDGEVDSLDDLLVGSAAVIEPAPEGDDDEEDSLLGGHGLSGGELIDPSEDDDEDDDPEPFVSPTDLSRRLAEGDAQAAQPPSGGKLALLVAAIIVGALIAVVVVGGSGSDAPGDAPAAESPE